MPSNPSYKGEQGRNRKAPPKKLDIPSTASIVAEPSPKRAKVDNVIALDTSVTESEAPRTVVENYCPIPISPRPSTAEAVATISLSPAVDCTLISPQSLFPLAQSLAEPVTENKTLADRPSAKNPEEPKDLQITLNPEPKNQSKIDHLQDMKQNNWTRIMYFTVITACLLGIMLSQAGSVPIMRSAASTSASNATNTTNTTLNAVNASIPVVNDTIPQTDSLSLHEEFRNAILDDKPELISALLQKDPTLASTPDANGWLPIHEAASGARVEVLRILMKHSKEHINARTSTGGSVLYWALEGDANHDYDHPVIQELIKNGAVNYPPDQPITSDTTVTDEVIHNFNQAAADNDVEKMNSILVEHPDVIHFADSNGYQAIHEAARFGHTEVVEFLILNGASVDTRIGSDFDGPTALYLALDNGLEEDHPTVMALWNAGAVPLAEGSLITDLGPQFTTVNFAPRDMSEAVRSGECGVLADYAAERPNWLRIMDENGWLPLHEAAILGHIECVDVILNAIGDVDFVNVRVLGTGGNALYYAKQELGEDSPMVEHLMSVGAEELEPMPDEL